MGGEAREATAGTSLSMALLIGLIVLMILLCLMWQFGVWETTAVVVHILYVIVCVVLLSPLLSRIAGALAGR